MVPFRRPLRRHQPSRHHLSISVPIAEVEHQGDAEATDDREGGHFLPPLGAAEELHVRTEAQRCSQWL